MLVRGNSYSRNQIADHIGYPETLRRGGTFFTGSFEHDGEFYLFANVGSAGRTGHDYANRWVNKDLLTTGRTGSHKDHPSIQQRVCGDHPVHIFWRAADRQHFTYAGAARAIEVSDSVPVEILWTFEDGYQTGNVGTLARSMQRSSKKDRGNRRGPRPTIGRREFERFDNGGFAYVFILIENLNVILSLETQFDVKIGCTNNLERRLSELNAGFPPDFGWRWCLLDALKFETSDEAYDMESKLLEKIRRQNVWTGGEFGRMSIKKAEAILGNPSSD